MLCVSSTHEKMDSI